MRLDEGKKYRLRIEGLTKMPQTRLEPRIIRYFPETNLGNGHEGLKKIAAFQGVDINALGWGEFLIFVNRSQTALKLYTCGSVIAHLKMPGHNRLDLRTIRFIPRMFNGTQINYGAALKAVIEKDFGGSDVKTT